MTQNIYWSEAEYGKLLHHPYHQEFMDELKKIVPESEHEWRGNGRWVSDAYLREVEILVYRFFEK